MRRRRDHNRGKIDPVLKKMPENYDVLVVGGGPSGLNTARILARDGFRVAVLERKRRIGDNVICTGIIGKEIFNKFELKTDSVLKELSEIHLISPFRTTLTYNHPFSFAYVVDRKKFDRNLSLDAGRKGAEIYTGHDVNDIVVNAGGVEVYASTAEKLYRYDAKMVVLATGIDVRLSKKLGLGYPRRFMNGIQAEVCIENDLIPSILVGRNIAPGAFAWIVPADKKKIRIGLLTEEDPKIYFNNLIQEFYPSLQNKLRNNKIPVKVIAQGLQTGSFQDRVLVVGEAAGQVKTTTGGGVSFGLFCSNIAAQVIKKQFDSGDFSSRYLSEYERLWRRSIQRELRVGYFTRKICSKLTDEETEQLFQLARSNGVFPLIKKMGDFDWHSDLILALLKKAPVLLNKMKFSRFKKGLNIYQ